MLEVAAEPRFPQRRRSVLRQMNRREIEANTRRVVVDFLEENRRYGATQQQTAKILSMSERTLGLWRQRQSDPRGDVKPRGRPLRRSSTEDRNALIEKIRDVGPHTGVERLRTLAPTMPRSEVADIVWRYRRAFRRRHTLLLHDLDWTTPGATWAMDHAEAPEPIDGVYNAILAVRDLATVEPLLWLPVSDMTAEVTIAALEALFAQRGRPFVLKCDNGSGFRSHAMGAFLKEQAVEQLFSPVRTPSYNGSCEVGIRHLKIQTEYEAKRNNRPGHWTAEDLARARYVRALFTNTTNGDPAVPADESARNAFRDAVREKELAAEKELRYVEIKGGERGRRIQIQRTALSRALLEHGFLHIKRRAIPLPKTHKFLANIS